MVLIEATTFSTSVCNANRWRTHFARTKTKLYKYIGESSRSCYERGWEHQGDCDQLKPGSHMLKHILDKHEGKQPGEVIFMMKALRFHKSAFERQVHEAVLIQDNRSHNILNSRSEYNRCALPRLGTKLGERETKDKRIEVEEEERKDQELEERIKKMRKDRQKIRKNDRQMGQPQRKRQKIDKEHDNAIEVLIQEMRRGEKRREKQQSLEECLEQSRQKKIRVEDSMLQLPSQDVLAEIASEMRCTDQSEQSADRGQAEQLSSGGDSQEARAEHQCNLIDDTNQEA
jgi:hypothetical protein